MVESQYGDAYYYPKVDSTGNVPNGYRGWEIEDMKARVLPLLSIGQMIEFIKEEVEASVYYHTNGAEWNIFFSKGDIDDWNPSDTKDELCDLLWEAVKQGFIHISMMERI